MSVTASPSTGFVVSVPGPSETWHKADKNQSEGRRGDEDPRHWVQVAFVDDPEYIQQILDRGWEPEPSHFSGFELCEVGANSGLRPTVFKSEADAERKIAELTARLRVRRDLRPSQPPNRVRRQSIHPSGDGVMYERGPSFEAENAARQASVALGILKEARVDSTAIQREFEVYAQEFRAAQADLELEQVERTIREAEALRARLTAEKGIEPSSTDWSALGEYRGIQHRFTAEGVEKYRARLGGKYSPTFDTLEQALRWQNQQTLDPSPGIEEPAIGRAEGSRPT